MTLTLQSKLPNEDRTQKLLFASSDPIGQSGIPGWEDLAADIFPGGSFRSDLAVARRLAYLESRSSRNSQVQELLKHENAFAPLTSEQRKNLEASGQDRAVYLITGQQPGLFGGPLLWMYKALTCAAMAKIWSQRLSRPVIPIFWVAGDDADLAECNQVELLDKDAEKVSGPFSLHFSDASLSIPVGERPINPAELANLLARLSAVWKPELVDRLRSCYPVPSTLTAGFLRIAQSILGKEGVLFVDGYSPKLRVMAQPVLRQAVLNWELYHNALSEGTSAAEAAGIPAQVSLRAGVVHAFNLRDKQRLRVLAEATHSNGLHQDRFYNADRPSIDLASELESLELSHDVFTRPLVADHIFPVLGHILGPAELKYFAQMSRLFLETTGDMPLLQPRMTAAVVTRSAWQDFQAEGIELADLVALRPSQLKSQLQEKIWNSNSASHSFSPSHGDAWVTELAQIHQNHFQDLSSLERFQKTLGIGWNRYLKSLKKLAYQNEAQSKQNLFNHLNWLGSGNGQDRHLNFPSLYNLLGKKGMDLLLASLDPIKTELQVFVYSQD